MDLTPLSSIHSVPAVGNQAILRRVRMTLLTGPLELAHVSFALGAHRRHLAIRAAVLRRAPAEPLVAFQSCLCHMVAGASAAAHPGSLCRSLLAARLTLRPCGTKPASTLALRSLDSASERPVTPVP